VTITVTCNLWAPSSGDHLFTCGAISRPPQYATFRSGCFCLADSVWDVSLWGHFGQTKKPCRNLTCSHLIQAYLNQREVLF